MNVQHRSWNREVRTVHVPLATSGAASAVSVMVLTGNSPLLATWRERLPLQRGSVDITARTGTGRSSERGSAGVMAMIAVAFLAAVTWVALLKCDLVLTRMRVQTAADVAALTAAQMGCPPAADIARRNGARLDSCQADAGTLSSRVRVCVDARVDLPRGFTVCAHARAGTRMEPTQ